MKAGSPVLLRTFLFLTMSGTPTGDRFNEDLRIGNYEKRWFDLDRFIDEPDDP
ncbi:hypothetical protein KKC22_14105 [Myxococcota bacterium]|nr:hypothetical protein [Myxococcota bacterium]